MGAGRFVTWCGWWIVVRALARWLILAGRFVTEPQLLTWCRHSTRFLFSAKRKPVEPERNAEGCSVRTGALHSAAALARAGSISASPFFLTEPNPLRWASSRGREGCEIRGLAGILVWKGQILTECVNPTATLSCSFSRLHCISHRTDSPAPSLCVAFRSICLCRMSRLRGLLRGGSPLTKAPLSLRLHRVSFRQDGKKWGGFCTSSLSAVRNKTNQAEPCTSTSPRRSPAERV